MHDPKKKESENSFAGFLVAEQPGEKTDIPRTESSVKGWTGKGPEITIMSLHLLSEGQSLDEKIKSGASQLNRDAWSQLCSAGAIELP